MVSKQIKIIATTRRKIVPDSRVKRTFPMNTLVSAKRVLHGERGEGQNPKGHGS